MAVERIYIDDENTETALEKLSEYLKKTAVSKYFSKVEINEDVISCYTDNDFLMMTIGYPLSTAGVTVYTRNGTFLNIKTGSSSYTKFSNAYECINGISFQINQTTTSNHPFAFTITKDETENTTIVLTNNLRISSESTVSTYIINENSGAINPIKTVPYDAHDFVKTVLAPFVVAGDNGNYTPDVFLQLFGHNTEQGTLDINDVKYFSNGLWCIKDE